MLPKSEFGKNVLTVLTGTTLAQAIPIAISPILTRLYSPEDFGVFYLFSSITAILLIGSTGKYELAVLIPTDKKEAINIAAVAGTICTLVSFTLFLLIFLFNDTICQLLNEPSIQWWLYFIPLAIFINGWYILFNFWHNRHKRFGLMTQSKFLTSGGNAGGRIGLGWLNWGIGGLIIGTLIGQTLGFFAYLIRFIKKDQSLITVINWASMKVQARQYQHFAKNMVPGSFFNTGSAQLPIILLNSYYSAATVGFYGFMQRIIKLPLATIGKSFDEVFKQKASEELQEKGHCRAIFYRTLKQITAITFIPFLILFFVAPQLFSFVFGSKWAIAGIYAQIFTIPFFLHFIVSSLTSVFYLTEHTLWYTFAHLVQFVLVLLSLIIGNYLQLEAITVMYLLAFAYGFSYLMMFFLLLKIVQKKPKEW